MRYYIEAFDRDGMKILGNLDGQAALGHMKQPQKSKAWQKVLKSKRGSRVAEYRLVNELGEVQAILFT